MRHSILAFTSLAATLCALAPPVVAQGKDSVTVCQTLEPPILDPGAGAAAAIREVTYDNIFETLVAFDANAKVEPRLAERWSTSEDGLKYTFILRKGVTFHDGAALTSADVKASFERAMGGESKNAQKWIFNPVASVEASDSHTVVVTLKEFVGNFVETMAWADATVFSAASMVKAATDPVGTGPYAFVRWNRGDRVILKRFDGYWGKKPAIANASFRFVNDPQAQVSALLAGDCDVHTNIGAQEAVPQLRADTKLRVAIGRTEGETIVAINNAKPPFNDIRVRRALAMAIDKTLVNEGAVSGFGTLIGSHFSPNHPAYVDLAGAVKYDPKAAKALLAEAGHPNGLAITLRLPPVSYARRGGEVVAAMLAEIGVKATIEPVEWPQWLERVFRNKDFDLTIISHVEPMDIGNYARDDYYFGYKSPEFREFITKARTGRSEGERFAALQSAQRKLADDQVNVFLFMLPKITVHKAGLKGMWTNWPVPANPLGGLVWE